MTTGAPTGFAYLDYSDDTKTYSTLTDYVEWNQAQTTYPWSAMGCTYNWNSLQTSSTDTTLGYDPLAPSSPFGLSEFIVSAGSKIVNEGFVPNAQLGIWAVPEPSAWVIAILGLTGLGAAVRSWPRRQRAAAAVDPQCLQGDSQEPRSPPGRGHHEHGRKRQTRSEYGRGA